MLNKTLYTGLILIIFTIGCKKVATIDAVSFNDSNVKLQLEDTVTYKIVNADFSLEISSYILKDTLDVDDYKEDKFSSPIILSQELSFFENEKLVKMYKLPIKRLEVKTITKKTINIMHTPIYKICITKNSKNDFYVISGAEYDYCNGVDCLEFIGIYSMRGNKIYEGYSNENKQEIFAEILKNNNIELNKSKNCIEADDFLNR